jgi:hypothetical protein
MRFFDEFWPSLRFTRSASWVKVQSRRSGKSLDQPQAGTENSDKNDTSIQLLMKGKWFYSTVPVATIQ